MANMKDDKQALANLIGLFVDNHGVEEASKLLSRSLLGMAHMPEVGGFEFTDQVGRVHVVPCSVPDTQQH